MPQGPYGRGPSQINIPVQKRKQKRMIKRTKERKKKETKKKNDTRETKTAQIKSAIHSKLPYACNLRNQKISIRSFSFLQERFIQVESSKRGFHEGGRRVGLPAHEIS